MIILGIDPSFTATGYAILRKQQDQYFLIDYGFLGLLTPQDPLQNRIGHLFDFFEQLIIQHKITHISLETPFLGKNAEVFLKLGYLRGALMVLAHRHQLSLREFSPREVKAAVTGFGNAQKDQVAHMVQILFPKLSIIKSRDITDAIAVTLCGLWINR
jgi:crossover junction endodeoxyribonuclease RuvC